MKITGAPGAPPTPSLDRPGAVRPAAAASAPAPVDPVAIAGIPEAELTPRVRAALASLLQELADLRRELDQARARMNELEAMASADPLLGILNRRAFVGELNRALAMGQRYRQPASLIFIDLDGLKAINDRHGHAAGDAALAHAASVIGANIRQTDVFGRLGGDEFAIILTNTAKAQAEQKARALADLVRTSPFAFGPVEISCGVVEIGSDRNAEAALEAADRLMYEEKRRK
jgi:diguanylate cyclase (GGDEF)-like protein